MVGGLHPLLNYYCTAGDGDVPPEPSLSEDEPSDPPCGPKEPWSEGGSDSDDDTVHVMGENDPQPVYEIKENIKLFDTPRSRIAGLWEGLDGTSPGTEQAPIPWDECDLAFADIQVRPDYKMERFFHISEGKLLADIQESTVHIKMVSDMYSVPWSTKRKDGWPGDAGAASDMIREFLGLVERGEVTLYEDGQAPRGLSISVLFDLPIPATPELQVLHWRARPIQTGDAWRSMAKWFQDTCAPPWLKTHALCPDWWPRESYHGRRQTVCGYVDGNLAPQHGDLTGGSDVAIKVGTIRTEGGVSIAVFAYLVDLYDSRNAAIWVDTAKILMNSVVKGLQAFVVGSSRNSCFIDRKTERLLSLVTTPQELTLTGYHPRIKYPKLESCRRVGVSLRNPKSEKSLGWIAMATRMRVDGAVRAIALNPHELDLRERGNCFFALFRDCTSGAGRAVGPVSANQILNCGLFLPDSFFLRLTVNERWVSAADGHLKTVPSYLNGTPREVLCGWYGLPDPRDKLEPLFTRTPPPDNGFSISFSEPGETSVESRATSPKGLYPSREEG